jgi:hypothetical protein
MSPRSALLPQLGALGLQSPQGTAIPLPAEFSSESPTSPVSPSTYGSPLQWPAAAEVTECDMEEEVRVKDEEVEDEGMIGSAGGWGEEAWTGEDEGETSQARSGARKISPITGKPT